MWRQQHTNTEYTKTKWASASHCSLRLTSTSNHNNNNIHSHCICRGRPNASSSGTLQFPMAILLTCAATHINVRLEYFGAETCERGKCGEGWRLPQRRGKREGNVHNTHSTHTHSLTYHIFEPYGKYRNLLWKIFHTSRGRFVWSCVCQLLWNARQRTMLAKAP